MAGAHCERFPACSNFGERAVPTCDKPDCPGASAQRAFAKMFTPTDVRDPHELEQVKQRVERTICPTWNSQTGKESVEGRISRDDFDYLLTYIAACERMIGGIVRN